ncbi:hypothetical protein JB92DRAFT_2828568 [Gautieria morchelliformis]|nr:hypothetical protein JB92DRAFT_2828568 [Gautieria morchelliformis]
MAIRIRIAIATTIVLLKLNVPGTGIWIESMIVDLEAVQPILTAFWVLHVVGGHIGIPCILFTILGNRTVTRHPVFVNFCITWMCYSASYILLLYAGQIYNMSPPSSLCFIQGAMIYASGGMIGVSTFIFVLHLVASQLFLVVRGAVYPNPQFTWNRLCLAAVIVAPYMVFFAAFTAGVMGGAQNQPIAHRSSYYCTIENVAIPHLGSGIAGLCAILATVVGMCIIATIYRHWCIIRGARGTMQDLSLVIRGMVFMLACALSLFICVALMLDIEAPPPNLALACLPMFAFLTFGTQRDILDVWFPWRKAKDIGPSGHHPIPITGAPSFVIPIV